MTTLVSDPSQYGSRGQNWHPDFVEYMVSIFNDPAYVSMPDGLKSDGKIQWEAPSNRSGGLYQFTHQKRAQWWKEKAENVGIDPSSAKWISKTAKKIHPFGEKPCKRCGRIMRIAYVYPNNILSTRLQRIFANQIEVDRLEPIEDLLTRIVNIVGEGALAHFPTLLASNGIVIPNTLQDISEWIKWVEDVYVPQEPNTLSPGAMSNAPDRFDGFHSFNLCCRNTADTGRSTDNLRSYVTDRRVFEYWSEGDWISADKLMGIINSEYRNEPTADGGSPPATADHIGPISLGFLHRPSFRLLSRAANSAKNNRMTFWDVDHLRSAEKAGSVVASWYAQKVWDLRKSDVDTEEKALRLSKLMRDNQRNAIHLLHKMYSNGELLFLTTLLGLNNANFSVTFENLRINNFVTEYDNIVKALRTTKYSTEQKARRIRIGFDALDVYGRRLNRHGLLIFDEPMNTCVEKASKVLSLLPQELKDLNEKLKDIILDDTALREFVDRHLSDEVLHHQVFVDALNELKPAMSLVANELSNIWESDRYVRVPFDFESE